MEVFGGNFIEIVVGGAPFNAEVEAFLRKINFPYTIAYGMTECAPLICHSRWDGNSIYLMRKDCSQYGNTRTFR